MSRNYRSASERYSFEPDPYPIPPPIGPYVVPKKVKASIKAELARRERESAKRRAYYAANREKLLEAGRKSRAKKRAQRTHWWCLVSLKHPLQRKCSAIGTERPFSKDP